MAAVDHLFRMEKPGETGDSLRSTLMQVYRTTGKRPAALDGPRIPPPVLHVWEWFKELNQARTFGNSANPIGFSEIRAWADLTGSRPLPHEVQMIRALDALWLRHFGEKK